MNTEVTKETEVFSQAQQATQVVSFVHSVFKKEKVLTLITLKWKINGGKFVYVVFFV